MRTQSTKCIGCGITPKKYTLASSLRPSQSTQKLVCSMGTSPRERSWEDSPYDKLATFTQYYMQVALHDNKPKPHKLTLLEEHYLMHHQWTFDNAKKPTKIRNDAQVRQKGQLAYCLYENKMVRSPLAKVKPILKDFAVTYRSLSEKNRAKKNLVELTELKEKITTNPKKASLIIRAFVEKYIDTKTIYVSSQDLRKFAAFVMSEPTLDTKENMSHLILKAMNKDLPKESYTGRVKAPESVNKYLTHYEKNDPFKISAFTQSIRTTGKNLPKLPPQSPRTEQRKFWVKYRPKRMVGNTNDIKIKVMNFLEQSKQFVDEDMTGKKGLIRLEREVKRPEVKSETPYL